MSVTEDGPLPMVPALCDSCRRRSTDPYVCTAFPSGIPDEILFDGLDHRRPVAGDHGAQYLPDPARASALTDWLTAWGRQA